MFDLLDEKPQAECAHAEEPFLHVCDGVCCATQDRAQGGPADLMLDATRGYIPLWAANQKLRVRFNTASLARYRNPQAVKSALWDAFVGGWRQWGDAQPFKLYYSESRPDFEIEMMPADRCSASGACVHASAFFPNNGFNKLKVYPAFFKGSKRGRDAVMAHELGHIFGLRHEFAQISEKTWKSVNYGGDPAFTIMEYGGRMRMTGTDRGNLKALYAQAHRGGLRSINGVPIRLIKT